MLYVILGFILLVLLLVDYGIYLYRAAQKEAKAPAYIPPPAPSIPAPALPVESIIVPTAVAPTVEVKDGSSLLSSVAALGDLTTKLATQDLTNRITTLEGKLSSTFNQILAKPVVPIIERSADDQKTTNGDNTKS